VNPSPRASSTPRRGCPRDQGKQTFSVTKPLDGEPTPADVNCAAHRLLVVTMKRLT
jgi:hypothetical protein